ncbi:hypothetical protein [Citromicrobium bathyomarinum]|uniref:hypothetical protein n=1 Tax=Citromicrobium bathyomarinum TaxID=72174 RepID=UPI00315A30D3
MRISIGLVAVLGLLAGGCGNASADDSATSSGATSAAEAAQEEVYKPAPLRGPDLSGLFDAKEDHVLAPLTMDARMLLNYSYKSNDNQTALVSAGPREVPTTDITVTPRIIAPQGDDGLWKVRLDFEGQWEGLQVLGLGADTSPVSFDLKPDITKMYFAEPVTVVAKKLADLGIDVNPDGSPKVLRKLPGKGYPAKGSDTFDWHGQVSMVREDEGKTAFIFREGFFNDGEY